MGLELPLKKQRAEKSVDLELIGFARESKVRALMGFVGGAESTVRTGSCRCS